MATPFQLEETGLQLQAAIDLAQTAVQPDDIGSAAQADAADFATAVQGGKADTAVQPGDIGSAAQADAADFATAAQGGKADTAVQPNTPAQFGGPINYFEVLEDGTIRLIGSATVWDDVTPGIAAAKTSGPGVTFNTTEITLDFVANADLNDYAYYPNQFPHKMKLGSSVYLHLHWEQANANTPNWLFQYRWQRNGRAKTTAWTNYKSNTNAYTYVSGTLNQISYGAPVAPPVDYGISDILQIRLIRDTNNTTGLFSGADNYSGTVSVTSFDPHIKIDSLGSASEYAK